MAAELVAIATFYLLAKFSNPKYRLAIYAIGSVSIFLSSVLLSVLPVLISLIIFGIVSPLAQNMITTSMSAMIYEAIEKDPEYKEKRLDYIIIREIPLGVGRIIGVFLFLTMRKYFDFDMLLPVSFSLFPIIYVIMIPSLYFIWRKSKKGSVLSFNEM